MEAKEINRRREQKICVHCGDSFPIGRDEDLEICPDCEDKLQLCSCGDYGNKDRGAYIDGEFVCSHCLQDYHICDSCGDHIPMDDCHPAFGDCYCENCFGDLFFYCADCGEVTSWEDGTRNLCGSCYPAFRRIPEELKVTRQSMDEVSKLIRTYEKITTGVILRYYRTQAMLAIDPARQYLRHNTPKLSSAEILAVAKYLAATTSCELRYLKRYCLGYYRQGAYTLEIFDQLYFGRWSKDSRGTMARGFLTLTADWDDYDYERFLRSAAYLFYGDWGGGAIGGKPWASCAWWAAEWLRQVVEGGGYAPTMAWEMMLGAAHNGGRWLNKLGDGIVLVALNMGARLRPDELIYACSVYYGEVKVGISVTTWLYGRFGHISTPPPQQSKLKLDVTPEDYVFAPWR